MSKGKKTLLWVVGIPLLLIGFYFLAYPSYDWRQKMTVEVEFKGKLYSGSSIVQIGWRENDLIGAVNGPNWIARKRGEAVVVNLEHGRFLFALLSSGGNSGYIENLATKSLYNNGKNRVWGKQAFRRVMDFNKPIMVPRKLYPLLVTFTDISDPKTVKRVEPNDLVASFGAGYVLKSITLEITDAPVTKSKVEGVLGWLTWSRDKFLKAGGGTNPMKMPNDSPRGYVSLSRTNFQKGN